MGQQPQPAGPASGKYGGFGSKDMEQFGYNNPDKFGSAYDPYVSKNSQAPPIPQTQPKGFTQPTSSTTKASEYKSHAKKKRKEEESSSDSGSDSSSSDDDTKKKKKAKSAGLGEPKKAERTI